MIKIISGYTNAGGSTVALITLTNCLNDIGIETVMYGNQEYFLDKCNSDLLKNITINKEDVLLCHHINIVKPECKKVIYINHEKEWSLINKIDKYWDKIIFSNKEIVDFFNYQEDYSIIPNLKQPLKFKDKKHLSNIAGVIGTIEYRKQTHLSILKALEDGCEKVLLFGNISPTYFKDFVEPLLSDKVIHIGYEPDMQKMYDQIGIVYQSSISEVATLVKDDCVITGTKFIGNENTSHEVSCLSNEEIINMWKNELLN